MEPYELVGNGIRPDVALKVDVVSWPLLVIVTIGDVVVIVVILVIDDVNVIDDINAIDDIGVIWSLLNPPVRRLSGSKEAPSRKETWGLSAKTVSIFLTRSVKIVSIFLAQWQGRFVKRNILTQALKC